MKLILFNLVLVLLLSLGNAEGGYSKFATLKNPDAINKIAFFDNDQSFFVYSKDKDQIYFFRSYDMKPLFNTKLFGPPLYLQAFVDGQGHNAILYAVDGGTIYVRSFFGGGEAGKQDLLVTLENCDILKVSPSPDKQSFAALCAGSTEVIIGDIIKQKAKVEKVDMQFTVTAFKWHPQGIQIAASGVDVDNGSPHLVVYDVLDKTITDYSNNLEEVTKIKDIQFSLDGKQVAFAQEESTSPDLVTILTFKNQGNKQYINALEATQLFQLKRNGKLLTSYDSQKSYVWEFGKQYYGDYYSNFKSSGLSNTGNYLFTLDPLSKDIIGNKICQNADEVFINDDLTCQKCKQSCNSCFGTQDQCSSCKIANYLDQTVFKCYPCLLGCLGCSNKDKCSKCDTTNHWVLDKNDKCVCQDGYLYLTNQCTSCASLMEGCLICSAENTCNKCQIGYDLNTQTNLCVRHKDDDDGSNIGLIIGIGIGALVLLAIISFFVIRIIRRRKAKKVQTLLESQGEHQNQELR